MSLGLLLAKSISLEYWEIAVVHCRSDGGEKRGFRVVVVQRLAYV